MMGQSQPIKLAGGIDDGDGTWQRQGSIAVAEDGKDGQFMSESDEMAVDEDSIDGGD